MAARNPAGRRPVFNRQQPFFKKLLSGRLHQGYALGSRPQRKSRLRDFGAVAAVEPLVDCCQFFWQQKCLSRRDFVKKNLVPNLSLYEAVFITASKVLYTHELVIPEASVNSWPNRNGVP